MFSNISTSIQTHRYNEAQAHLHVIHKNANYSKSATINCMIQAYHIQLKQLLRLSPKPVMVGYMNPPHPFDTIWSHFIQLNVCMSVFIYSHLNVASIQWTTTMSCTEMNHEYLRNTGLQKLVSTLNILRRTWNFQLYSSIRMCSFSRL